MKGLKLLLVTLKNEGAVALITGLLTFGLSLWLVPDAHKSAVAFALVAATLAGALDTLYFHLLFLLREAPIHTAEKTYHRVIEDVRQRLTDGSIRLREALIRRFEADYRRTVATARIHERSRRQLREAKHRLKARAWVIERVIPGHQLVTATAEAKTDPDLLEKWTDQVDGLVDARIEVQRRQTGFAGLINGLRPATLARQTLEEWGSFTSARGRDEVQEGYARHLPLLPP